jgi:transposase
MTKKKYVVRLSSDERLVLTDLVSAGKAAARAQAHARILLKADQGPDGPAWIDAEIVVALDTSLRTVERVREAWVTQGLEAALYPRPARAHRPRRLDGEQEAHLVALACSAPPAGQKRWTLRLLADQLVALDIVDGIAPETVRQTLKKTNSSRG